MPATLHKVYYPYAEYVAFEASSNVKHEYLDGQIYAMAGGTPEHAALASAVIALLFAQLRGGDCHAFTSDLRVRTQSGLTTYPDVTVICGPHALDETDRLAVTNPTFLAEVLSRSTAEYDAGDKFEHYKTLASLRQYVLVSHKEHVVTVWTRGENAEWRSQIVREGEVADLSAIDARLDVRELYEVAKLS
ncbi:MAG TPA: Uma2 family endonuclease [Thermoanaerobaculia bacterium]|nr:Uma2 family endonuclease [Thermoanaerobaculia bacterium]